MGFCLFLVFFSGFSGLGHSSELPLLPFTTSMFSELAPLKLLDPSEATLEKAYSIKKIVYCFCSCSCSCLLWLLVTVELDVTNCRCLRPSLPCLAGVHQEHQLLALEIVHISTPTVVALPSFVSCFVLILCFINKRISFIIINISV